MLCAIIPIRYLQKNFTEVQVQFRDEEPAWIPYDTLLAIKEKSQDSYISGDDDQAIYKWNGAHVNTFINLEGERTVLDQSQRVPQKPFALANRLIKRVTNRVEKEQYRHD